jgi:hypothetical protein
VLANAMTVVTVRQGNLMVLKVLCSHRLVSLSNMLTICVMFYINTVGSEALTAVVTKV